MKKKLISKSRYDIIDLKLYNREIPVIIGDVKDLYNKSLRENGKKSIISAILNEIKDSEFDLSDGKTYKIRIDRGVYIFMWFRDTNIPLATMAHEVCHTIQFLCEILGMDFIKECEATAYLYGYIIERCYKIIKNK